MSKAFVLINTEIGSESDVSKELTKVEGVEEVSPFTDSKTHSSKSHANTIDKLSEIVTWRIRRLDKVRSTLTIIIVEEK